MSYVFLTGNASELNMRWRWRGGVFMTMQCKTVIVEYYGASYQPRKSLKERFLMAKEYFTASGDPGISSYANKYSHSRISMDPSLAMCFPFQCANGWTHEG